MPRAMCVWFPMLAVDLLRRRGRMQGDAVRESRRRSERLGERRREARGAVPTRRPSPGAILLVAAERQRQVVVACCEQALAAGVRLGMPLAVARALFAGDAAARLRVEPADPHRVASALRALAQWAQRRLSPKVAVREPDGLLLDISGCARLFGGEANLLARASEGLRPLGFTVRLAIAPTFAGAWALARFGSATAASAPVIVPDDETALRAALAGLPVEALGLDAAIVAELAEVGVDRIGQLAGLPRSLLPSRFGETVLLRLDQALGRALEVAEPIRPVERLRLECCFDGPTTQWEAIEITVRRMLTELAEILGRAESGARRVVVTLGGPDRPPTATEIVLGQPSRDPRHLWTLLGPKLERVELESATGFGIERVIVAAPVVERMPHVQLAPWAQGEPHELSGRASAVSDPPTDQRRLEGQRREMLGQLLGQLLDILRNRLGPERISQAELTGSHWPERAARQRPLGEGDAGPGRSDAVHVVMPTTTWQASGLHHIDRPAVLLDVPEPAEIERSTPDGPLRRLCWRGRTVEILACIGPERLSPEWWLDGRQVGRWPSEQEAPHPHAAQADASHGQNRRRARTRPLTGPCLSRDRDYFKIHDEVGRWLWVFEEDGCWFVQGGW